jgi:predicted dehydrogenase
MRRVKVGVVGCGAINVDFRLPALREIAEVDIAAVVDVAPERALCTADDFGVERHYEDHRQLIGTVDAAIVATPNATHCAVSSDLLRAGIHVLCDKPMAVSSEECARMIEAREAGDAKLMVGHTMRYYPVLQDAKRLIDRECLGRIKHLECATGCAFTWPSRTGFYFDKKLAGGGVIMDMGCHLFDLGRWLLNEELTIRAVRAEDRMGKGVEDEAEIEGESTGGSRVAFRLSRNRRLNDTLRIKGEDGEMWCNLFKSGLHVRAAHLRICQGLDEVTIVQEVGGSVHFHELSHFVGCVLNGSSPLTSGESSAVAVRLVEDCYRELGS